MRSEKGSITVYVLIAMLTFTAFLIAIYVRNSNKEMAQIQTTEKIKAIYEDYDIDEVYATMTGKIPQILGYERGAVEITIKTLVENGLNVDQNGKEITYYAATTKNEAPKETSETDGTFGVWQKSVDISLLGYEETDIYIWIKNEDGNISTTLDTPIDTTGVQIEEGEYAGLNSKIYIDPEDNTKMAYIPAGFTVSNVEGETSIAEGLVVYSGNHENVSDMSTLQTSANQYVWIPVENPSDMYGTDVNGNYLGKLYNFGSSSAGFATSPEQATAYNWTETDGVMSWTDETSYREPAYLANSDYADDSEYNVDASENKIITEDGIQVEFNKMINSVETYNGFYIGRYELTGTVDNPTVVKGVVPLTANATYRDDYLRWYGLYTMCEKLEEGNDKVTTSMIWGSQWDQAVKKSIENKTDFLTNASTYGVYSVSSSTTSGTKASAYNIYDMSGNLEDWTLEASNTYNRVQRGGCYGYSASGRPASNRSGVNPYYNRWLNGSRPQLYL